MEVYDPALGYWSGYGALALKTNRANHTATLLQNGKVLIAGGSSTSGVIGTAEIFDPVAGKSTPVGSMLTNRSMHTATLLSNGKVLVTGGVTSGQFSPPLASAELFDPQTGTWSATNPMTTNRVGHATSLLSDGRVLVIGGRNGGGLVSPNFSSAELYDPSTGIWTPAGNMSVARSTMTATLLPNGKLLVVGGRIGTTVTGVVELFDPATGNWSVTNSLIAGRSLHTATLLPNGRILVTGGQGTSANLNSAEVYDPVAGTWATTATMSASRYQHAAILLASGQVLIAGGTSTVAEYYDYAVGSWTTAEPMNVPRAAHTATLLPNGKILVAGGDSGTDGILANAEVYDPMTGHWTAANPMGSPRYVHTATLLADGRVLIAGGRDTTNTSSTLATAEIFDPASGIWSPTGPMSASRSYFTATLLPTGKVLVAGGASTGVSLASAELYDPTTGTWTLTASMSQARDENTATMLQNGKVLLNGGFGSLYSDLYDPVTGTFAQTGLDSLSRVEATATLLPSGAVLLAGGTSTFTATAAASIFDPSGAVRSVHAMTITRYFHHSVLLPDGKVLVAGGVGPSGPTNTAEIFYPSAIDSFTIWKTTAPMTTNHYRGTLTLLLDGRALMCGGYTRGAALATTEIYDAGLGFDPSTRPVITSVTSPISLYANISITGSGFRGLSESSGGNAFQNSSTDFPLIQLRSFGSGVTTFVPHTNWSSFSVDSLPITRFPPGFAMMTVFVNGTPSTSSVIQINVPVPSPPFLANPRVLTNGAFQFSFTNTPGAILGVFATTNIALPLSNWTPLGAASEIGPGQFQFADGTSPGAARFYCVRLP